MLDCSSKFTLFENAVKWCSIACNSHRQNKVNNNEYLLIGCLQFVLLLLLLLFTFTLLSCSFTLLVLVSSVTVLFFAIIFGALVGQKLPYEKLHTTCSPIQHHHPNTKLRVRGNSHCKPLCIDWFGGEKQGHPFFLKTDLNTLIALFDFVFLCAFRYTDFENFPFSYWFLKC